MQADRCLERRLPLRSRTVTTIIRRADDDKTAAGFAWTRGVYMGASSRQSRNNEFWITNEAARLRVRRTRYENPRIETEGNRVA